MGLFRRLKAVGSDPPSYRHATHVAAKQRFISDQSPTTHCAEMHDQRFKREKTAHTRALMRTEVRF